MGEYKKGEEEARNRMQNEKEAGKKRQEELAKKLDEKKKLLQTDVN